MALFLEDTMSAQRKVTKERVTREVPDEVEWTCLYKGHGIRDSLCSSATQEFPLRAVPLSNHTNARAVINVHCMPTRHHNDSWALH